MNFGHLHVSYVPGLDRRRISSASTPYLHSLIQSYPNARIDTLPTTEHLPTILTGVPPHRHGLWGPLLRPKNGPDGLGARLFDILPDAVATTMQCGRHYLFGPFDGATLPPRRRRRFEWLRFKYMKGDFHTAVSQALNGSETIFTRLPGEATRYVYQEDLEKLDQQLADIASGDFRLEVLEAHCLDRVQHWWLHDEDKVAECYRKFDRFLRRLHMKCIENDICLMLISDHGMERVQHSIDLKKALKGSQVPANSYEIFIEPSKATIWFHDPASRERLEASLRDLEGGEVLSREDLARYGLHFEDGRYGDLYFYARPGFSIFPSDFYQPLANLVQGLLDWQQRPRINDPCHKGEHGYLPEHECEAGLLIIANKEEAIPERIRLVDIAPKIMDLVQVSGLGERGTLQHQ